MKRFRNEWKYICSDSDLEILKIRLDALLTSDSYAGETGIYGVHSLYFDDFLDSCARDNEAGSDHRFKYRIRYYRNNPADIHLERKEKVYGRCHKDSCPLTFEEYRMLTENEAADLFWQTEKPLLRRFCVDIMNRQFLPKLVVDYERLAYIEPITNIRVTFDRNICVSSDVSSFLDGDYHVIPIQEKELNVLEVKFDEILPGHIRLAVESMQLPQTTFSKFYLGRKCLEGVYL